MEGKQKQSNNKSLRLIPMLVLVVVLVWAGSRFLKSPEQPQPTAAPGAAETAAPLALLTEPPAPETPVPATETPAPENPLPEEVLPVESGSYTEVEEVAYYLHTYGHLPDNYMTKSEAEEAGWNSYKGNLWDVAYGMSIGGDRYGNYDGQLPKGERYYEADVNYDGGYRGEERIIYTEDGDIWYTSDHYESFERLY